jgi:hypothetical protein
MLQNLQYNQGIQSQAAGLLPGMTTAQYAGYTPYLGASSSLDSLPYYGTNALGNIGGLYSGYGTQTGQQPGGWMNGLFSAGASLGSAAIMASDRRGQQQGQPMPRMAGPQGFNGPMNGGQMTPPIMQGMPVQQGQMQPTAQFPTMGQQADPQEHQRHGMFGGPLGKFAPMFGLAGMMSGGGGLGSMLPFLLGGLGGGGLYSLLHKHHD